MLQAQSNINRFLSFISSNNVILGSSDLLQLKGLHLNRLYIGKTWDNQLIGLYAPSTIEYKKIIGAEWRWVTLSDTFTHYKTLNYSVKDSKLFLSYEVEYAPYFLAKYGKSRVMRLSREERLLVIIRTIKNYLKTENKNGGANQI